MTEASDIVVVGEVDAHTDLRRLVEETALDVLVLDVEILGRQFAPSDAFLQALPVPILIVTACQDEETICAWVQAGVAGYLLLDEPVERVVAAVRGVARGERVWFSRWVIDMLANQVHKKTASRRENTRLTEREVDVLQALAGGRRNIDIAEELDISVNTVQFHLKNIYHKLNVSTRSEAILWAVHNGFAEG
ncbi:MAG: response regulator transcription factor [Anaerolineae bacterium]|jgi:DNA-binding NarL/FixJ family response regulator